MSEATEKQEAFERRTIPHLDLKRDEHNCYHYSVTQMAFCDFSDGWNAALSYERTRATGKVGEDIDDSPSVIFEEGRQEANREWRKKLYRDGGKEIMQLLTSHYNKQHLSNLLDSTDHAASVDSLGGIGGVEFRPCPFCGNDWINEALGESIPGVYYRVCLCNTCGAEGQRFCFGNFIVEVKTEDTAKRQARTAWNTRTQPSPAKPQEAISGEGLNTGDGFIWNGRDFLRVAPGMETFVMLAMEQTLSNEVLEEEALLIMQAGIFEIVDPTQPLDAGTALVLAYRALTKEARIIPRAGKQTKENTHG